MPKLGPIKRRQLVKYLRQQGFDGPYGRGSNHDIMIKGNHTITIPNPHGSREIGKELLRKVIRQAGISEKEWESM